MSTTSSPSSTRKLRLRRPLDAVYDQPVTSQEIGYRITKLVSKGPVLQAFALMPDPDSSPLPRYSRTSPGCLEVCVGSILDIYYLVSEFDEPSSSDEPSGIISYVVSLNQDESQVPTAWKTTEGKRQAELCELPSSMVLIDRSLLMSFSSGKKIIDAFDLWSAQSLVDDNMIIEWPWNTRADLLSSLSIPDTYSPPSLAGSEDGSGITGFELPLHQQLSSDLHGTAAAPDTILANTAGATLSSPNQTTSESLSPSPTGSSPTPADILRGEFDSPSDAVLIGASASRRGSAPSLSPKMTFSNIVSSNPESLTPIAGDILEPNSNSLSDTIVNGAPSPSDVSAPSARTRAFTRSQRSLSDGDLHHLAYAPTPGASRSSLGEGEPHRASPPYPATASAAARKSRVPKERGLVNAFHDTGLFLNGSSESSAPVFNSAVQGLEGQVQSLLVSSSLPPDSSVTQECDTAFDSDASKSEDQASSNPPVHSTRSVTGSSAALLYKASTALVKRSFGKPSPLKSPSLHSSSQRFNTPRSSERTLKSDDIIFSLVDFGQWVIEQFERFLPMRVGSTWPLEIVDGSTVNVNPSNMSVILGFVSKLSGNAQTQVRYWVVSHGPDSKERVLIKALENDCPLQWKAIALQEYLSWVKGVSPNMSVLACMKARQFEGSIYSRMVHSPVAFKLPLSLSMSISDAIDESFSSSYVTSQASKVISIMRLCPISPYRIQLAAFRFIRSYSRITNALFTIRLRKHQQALHLYTTQWRRENEFQLVVHQDQLLAIAAYERRQISAAQSVLGDAFALMRRRAHVIATSSFRYASAVHMRIINDLYYGWSMLRNMLNTPSRRDIAVMYAHPMGVWVTASAISKSSTRTLTSKGNISFLVKIKRSHEPDRLVVVERLRVLDIDLLSDYHLFEESLPIETALAVAKPNSEDTICNSVSQFGLLQDGFFGSLLIADQHGIWRGCSVIQDILSDSSFGESFILSCQDGVHTCSSSMEFRCRLFDHDILDTPLTHYDYETYLGRNLGSGTILRLIGATLQTYSAAVGDDLGSINKKIDCLKSFSLTPESPVDGPRNSCGCQRSQCERGCHHGPKCECRESDTQDTNGSAEDVFHLGAGRQSKVYGAVLNETFNDFMLYCDCLYLANHARPYLEPCIITRQDPNCDHSVIRFWSETSVQEIPKIHLAAFEMKLVDTDWTLSSDHSNVGFGSKTKPYACFHPDDIQLKVPAHHTGNEEDANRRGRGSNHNSDCIVATSTARYGITGGLPHETEEQFIDACDILVETSSGILRPAIYVESSQDSISVRMWCAMAEVSNQSIIPFRADALDQPADNFKKKAPPVDPKVKAQIEEVCQDSLAFQCAQAKSAVDHRDRRKLISDSQNEEIEQNEIIFLDSLTQSYLPSSPLFSLDAYGSVRSSIMDKRKTSEGNNHESLVHFIANCNILYVNATNVLTPAIFLSVNDEITVTIHDWNGVHILCARKLMPFFEMLADRSIHEYLIASDVFMGASIELASQLQNNWILTVCDMLSSIVSLASNAGTKSVYDCKRSEAELFKIIELAAQHMIFIPQMTVQSYVDKIQAFEAQVVHSNEEERDRAELYWVERETSPHDFVSPLLRSKRCCFNTWQEARVTLLDAHQSRLTFQTHRAKSLTHPRTIIRIFPELIEILKEAALTNNVVQFVSIAGELLYVVTAWSLIPINGINVHDGTDTQPPDEQEADSDGDFVPEGLSCDSHSSSSTDDIDFSAAFNILDKECVGHPYAVFEPLHFWPEIVVRDMIVNEAIPPGALRISMDLVRRVNHHFLLLISTADVNDTKLTSHQAQCSYFMYPYQFICKSASSEDGLCMLEFKHMKDGSTTQLPMSNIVLDGGFGALQTKLTSQWQNFETLAVSVESTPDDCLKWTAPLNMQGQSPEEWYRSINGTKIPSVPQASVSEWIKENNMHYGVDVMSNLEHLSSNASGHPSPSPASPSASANATANSQGASNHSNQRSGTYSYARASSPPGSVPNSPDNSLKLSGRHSGEVYFDSSAQKWVECRLDSCQNLLQGNHKVCGVCGTARADLCVCVKCQRLYDPNFEKVCPICTEYLPHSKEATQIQINKRVEGKSDDVNDQSMKKTAELLQVQINTRMLSRLRSGGQGPISGNMTISNSRDALLQLIRWCKDAQLDPNKSKRPFPDCLISVDYGIIFHLSQGMIGPPDYGLSLWDMIRLFEPDDAKRKYYLESDGKKFTKTNTFVCQHGGIFIQAVKDMCILIEFFWNKDLAVALQLSANQLLAWRATITNPTMANLLAPWNLLVNILDAVLMNCTQIMIDLCETHRSIEQIVADHRDVFLSEHDKTGFALPVIRDIAQCNFHRTNTVSSSNFNSSACTCRWTSITNDMIQVCEKIPGSDGVVGRSKPKAETIRKKNDDGTPTVPGDTTPPGGRQKNKARGAGAESGNPTAREYKYVEDSDRDPLGDDGRPTAPHRVIIMATSSRATSDWAQARKIFSASTFEEGKYTDYCLSHQSFGGCRNPGCTLKHKTHFVPAATLKKYPEIMAAIVGRGDGLRNVPNTGWTQQDVTKAYNLHKKKIVPTAKVGDPAGENTPASKTRGGDASGGDAEADNDDAAEDEDAGPVSANLDVVGKPQGGNGVPIGTSPAELPQVCAPVSQPNTSISNQIAEAATAQTTSSQAHVSDVTTAGLFPPKPSVTSSTPAVRTPMGGTHESRHPQFRGLELLPPDFTLVREQLSDFPSQIGPVFVTKAVSNVITYSIPSEASSVIIKSTVLDLGESMDPYSPPGYPSQKKQCVLLSYSGAQRTDPWATKVNIRSDICTWKTEYFDGNVMSMGNAQMAFMSTPDSTEAIKFKKELSVASTCLARGQPITPFFLTFVRQSRHPVACWFNVGNRRECAIAVPPEACNADGTFKNLPLISLEMSESHSEVAIISEISIDGTSHLFNESLTEVNDETWEGLRLNDFVSLIPDLRKHFKVSMFGSLTMQQYFDEEQFTFPDMVSNVEYSEQLGADMVRGTTSFVSLKSPSVAMCSCVLLLSAMFAAAGPFDSSSSSQTSPSNNLRGGYTATSSLMGYSAFSNSTSVGTLTSPMGGSKPIPQLHPEPQTGPKPTVPPWNTDSWDGIVPASQLDTDGFIIPVSLEEAGSQMDAYHMLIRALTTVELVRRSGTDSTDISWRRSMSEAYANVSQWMPAALSNQHPSTWISSIEKIYRNLWHPFSASAHMDPTSIQTNFDMIDPDTLQHMMRTATVGVSTGIPSPDSTVFCSSSTTALQFKTVILDHLWSYQIKAFVHMFPPQSERIIDSCNVRFSQMHYVPDQDRPVVNPSHPGTDPDGLSPNDLSPDIDYQEVQADYTDRLADGIVTFLTLVMQCGFSVETNVAAIKADIAKAFLQIPLDWKSVGSLSVRFQNTWIFRDTPFGWKWASQTFAPFPRGIKQRVMAAMRDVLRSPIHTPSLSPAQRELMATSWETVFAYCDDFLAVTLMMDTVPHQLTRHLRQAGYESLGYAAWNIKKAAEDGFFSFEQTFTGVVFDMKSHTVFFEADKWIRLKAIMVQAVDSLAKGTLSFPLHFVQSVFGLLIWIIRVFPKLKHPASPWRRMLCGVSTDSDKTTQCFPVLGAESRERGARKLLLDCTMLRDVADYAIKFPQRVFSKMAALRPEVDYDDGKIIYGSCGMDASLTAVAFCCHKLREVVIMPIPEPLRILLQKVLDGGVTDTLKQFTIAIFEYLAVPFCQFQWGSAWRDMGFDRIRMHIDNSNAESWINSGFSSSSIGQDLCRITGCLEFAFNHSCIGVRVPTWLNKLMDLASRVVLNTGLVCPVLMQEFHDYNATFDVPYNLVPPVWQNDALMNHLVQMRHAFDIISPFPFLAGALESSLNTVQCGGKAVTRSISERLSPKQYLHQFRTEFTMLDAKEWCASKVAAFTMSSYGTGVCISEWAASRTRQFRSLFGSEVVPEMQSMYEDLTSRVSLGDAFQLDPAMLPYTDLAVFTFPCIDYSSIAANTVGQFGSTGWMLSTGVVDILTPMPVKPKVVVVETTANALKVHGGAAIELLRSGLRGLNYVVSDRKVAMNQWDATNRCRYICVATLQEVTTPSNVFEWPSPVFNSSFCPCLADIMEDDSLIPAHHWFNRPRQLDLLTSVNHVLRPMQVHRLAQYAPGIGHSSFPHQVRGRLGGIPTLLPTMGNIQVMREDYVHGDSDVSTRRLSTPEGLNGASMASDFEPYCRSFNISPDAAHGGIPGGFSFALFDAVATFLTAADVPKTTNFNAWSDGEYVTSLTEWQVQGSSSCGSADTSGLHTPRGAPRSPHTVAPAVRPALPGRPSDDQIRAMIPTLGDVDCTQPLHPTKKGRNGYVVLTGDITHAEWVCMHHASTNLDSYELEADTAARYAGGQRMFHEFMIRHPGVTSEKRERGIIFDEAVWRPSEVESILIDFVLHDVGVRGNGWSTVMGKLYAVRHANVRAGSGNPLTGKLQLNQILRALKKFRGPKNKKAPVTRPMLLMIKELLDFSSQDSIVLWAAITVAFFLMARSAEYSAKLPRGQFDMDKVFRRSSVRFFMDQIEIFTDLQRTSRVVVKFAVTTKAGGGEERVLHKLDHELCPVAALVNLFTMVPTRNSEEPLFIWPVNSRKAGMGVRYDDVSSLLKESALQLGIDPKSIGTHSLRRGGASAYLMAACPFNSVRMYGRWRSDCVKEYIDVWDNMMLGASHRVARGYKHPDIHPTAQPAARSQLAQHADAQWDAFVRGSGVSAARGSQFAPSSTPATQLAPSSTRHSSPQASSHFRSEAPTASSGSWNSRGSPSSAISSGSLV